MKPDAHKKMSRRDVARAKFMINFRNSQKIKNSYRNRATVHIEKMKDIEEMANAGVLRQKGMKYAELVEEMNKDLKALEHMEKPLTLYKDEKAMMAEAAKV